MTDKTIKLSREDLESGRVTVPGPNGRYSLALLPSDVHDPTELPTFLAGYKPFRFRADEVSPPILVDNDEDKYRVFSSDDAFRHVEVKQSSTASVPEVDPSSSLTTYKVVDKFVGSFVPRQTESQTGNAYRPLMVAGKRAMNAILLDREIDVWTLLETNTNWATANRLAVTNTWDSDLGTPIADVQTAIQASAQEVTGVWMNEKVAHAFLRHADVKDHMRQFGGDAVVQRVFGDLGAANVRNVDFGIPGLPPFHVATAKVKNEDTAALDYVLDDVCVLVTMPMELPPQDGEEVASSYTFRRRGPNGNGIEVREFTVEARGPYGGTMVVVSLSDTAEMVANTCGGIITGVHS